MFRQFSEPTVENLGEDERRQRNRLLKFAHG
jgi:hypothetical protein